MSEAREKKRGIAILPLVVIASFIVLTVGLAIAFVTFIENMTAFSARKADEARLTARSGINDALEKILRDPSGAPIPYDLAVGNGTTTVTINRNRNENVGATGCTETVSNYFCVESLGKVQDRQSKMRAVAAVDPDNGQITVVSVKEVAI